MDTEKKSPRPRRTKKVIEKEMEARELKHKLAYIFLIIGIIYCVVNRDAAQEAHRITQQAQETQMTVEKAQTTQTQLKPTDKKFIGILQSYDTSCFSDGVCSITVSGVKVIETIGGRQKPQKELGRLIGVNSIRDFGNHIGKKFEIYAEPQPNGEYSLYGSRDYYIKLMNHQ